MKKELYLCATIFVGIWGFRFSVASAMYGDFLIAYLVSNLGIVLPVVLLEIAKLIHFKGEERRVYSFDILGIVISAFAVLYLTCLFLSDSSHLSRAWLQEFVFMYWPWVVSLLIQSLLLACKYKKKAKNMGDDSLC